MDTEATTDIPVFERPELAAIRVYGADARSFLHAQTTQAIADMPARSTRAAAWLTPQGRVQALFDVVADDDGLVLVLPGDNAGFLAEQLARFVLRAAVTIEADSSRRVFSLPSTALADSDSFARQPDIGAAAAIEETLIFRPDADNLCMLSADIAAVAGLRPSTANDDDTFESAAIARGRPQITAALRGLYVPHMLGLDRLNAISFTKGCYPGQEIVARSEHRGQVKRGLLRYALPGSACPAPGAAIVDLQGQAAGEVNRSARTADGVEILAVTRLDDRKPLQLAADGRRLALLTGPDEG